MNFFTLSRVVCGVILSCLIVCGNANAQTPTIVGSEGVTQLTITLSNGANVEVVLHQAKVNDSYPYKHGMLWGGDDMELPQAILTSIDVQVGKKQIFVPLSAFSDLGEVKSASLEIISKGFNLRLHGGNTAASYDATLTFKRGHLRNKKVTLREFPEQRWENTIYSFTTSE